MCDFRSQRTGHLELMMDDDSSEYYLMTNINGGQQPDRRTERRSSQTVRSELSDTLRRVNNQEASRLQVIPQF